MPEYPPHNSLFIVVQRAISRAIRFRFWVLFACAVPVYYVIGRHQWFNRDDWAQVLTRDQMLADSGVSTWLFGSQDGHLLSVTIALFKAVSETFGYQSYWPFLLLAMLSHAGAVLLWNHLSGILGVSESTRFLFAAVLLFLGPGWHNITFAVQVCYNVPLCCFFAQLIVLERYPESRRAIFGLGVLGLLAVGSSGLGPIYVLGVATYLTMRRRWRSLGWGVVPALAVYAWWMVTWWQDPVRTQLQANRALVPEFVAAGVISSFEALVGISAVAGLALVATIAWAGWLVPPALRPLAAVHLITVVLLFGVIGWERVGFGVGSAASSRYVHSAAFLLAAPLAAAIDSIRRQARAAHGAARVLVGFSAVLALSELRVASAEYAIRSRTEQRVFELVAGMKDVGDLDPSWTPVLNSPTIRVADLAWMVDAGMITPRSPESERDRQLLDLAVSSGLPQP